MGLEPEVDERVVGTGADGHRTDQERQDQDSGAAPFERQSAFGTPCLAAVPDSLGPTRCRKARHREYAEQVGVQVERQGERLAQGGRPCKESRKVRPAVIYVWTAEKGPGQEDDRKYIEASDEYGRGFKPVAKTGPLRG